MLSVPRTGSLPLTCQRPLYQTLSLDTPWDGTYMGKEVTNDVYVYILKYTGMCTGQEEFQHTGHVTVVR